MLCYLLERKKIIKRENYRLKERNSSNTESIFLQFGVNSAVSRGKKVVKSKNSLFNNNRNLNRIFYYFDFLFLLANLKLNAELAHRIYNIFWILPQILEKVSAFLCEQITKSNRCENTHEIFVFQLCLSVKYEYFEYFLLIIPMCK